MVQGILVVAWLRYWKVYGKQKGLWDKYGDFSTYFFNSSCWFVTYFPLVNLAILLSSDYALVNLDKYHCRRLTRILKDENIFGFNGKPNYKKILVDKWKFGLDDDSNHNCSTELNLNFDL